MQSSESAEEKQKKKSRYNNITRIIVIIIINVRSSSCRARLPVPARLVRDVKRTRDLCSCSRLFRGVHTRSHERRPLLLPSVAGYYTYVCTYIGYKRNCSYSVYVCFFFATTFLYRVAGTLLFVLQLSFSFSFLIMSEEKVHVKETAAAEERVPSTPPLPLTGKNRNTRRKGPGV